MPTLLLCAPLEALPPLEPLLHAWAQRGVQVSVRPYIGAAPDMQAEVHRCATAPTAALLVGSARRAPQTVLPGPMLIGPQGQRVAVGWLPMASRIGLGRFARHAAAVHRRQGPLLADVRARAAPNGALAQVRGGAIKETPACGTGLALLGQWQPQYMRLAQRVCKLLGTHQPVWRWTGEGLSREDMVQALGSGLGLGLYIGHGRAMGWVGYHGVRAHHFTAAPAQRAPERTLGALLNLCCRTASRRRVGLSFAEELVLQGVCASSLGAVGDTLHTDNTRWATGVCNALLAGARTVGELVCQAAPLSAQAVRAYRLVGDPLAPLSTPHWAGRKAARVPTYA